MNRLLMVLATLGLLGGSAIDVKAEAVAFEFEGIVDDVSDIHGYLGGQVSPGMIFLGTYTFESTKPDADPSPTWGRYNYSNVPGEFSMTVEIPVPDGYIVFQTAEISPGSPSSTIYVENNQPGPTRDEYFFSTSEAVCSLFPFSLCMCFDLETYQHLDVITSDALLLIPPPLAPFEVSRTFQVFNEVPSFSLSGHLTGLHFPTSAVQDSDRVCETWGEAKKRFK